ncbi:MAG: 50S ribosomal protein L24 [Candidatus Woesearchaeota archaeon]|nr:50S ribosomal protein L24 [Candidatus Woesearchaeota archaeon]
MEKTWSSAWKASTKPRKQRKYRANLPLHLRKKRMQSPLAKELKKKYNTNAATVHQGDTVRVLRGSSKGKTGKVDQVSYTKECVYITGISVTRKDGTQKPRGVNPSKILITELNLSDKRREEQLKH